MKRSFLALAVLALVSMLLLGGCGGDSDGSSSEEKTLTKKQFVRLTEDFCDKEYRAEERDMERYAEKHNLTFGGGKPWEEEELNEAIVFDYVRDKIAYFKSLPAPEGDEKEVREMIEAFEDGLRTSEETPEALVEARPGKKPLPEPFTESYHTTFEYGPWLCAQP